MARTAEVKIATSLVLKLQGTRIAPVSRLCGIVCGREEPTEEVLCVLPQTLVLTRGLLLELDLARGVVKARRAAVSVADHGERRRGIGSVGHALNALFLKPSG